jgi:RNA polymerase sigma-70 factor (ECF subfamily)
VSADVGVDVLLVGGARRLTVEARADYDGFFRDEYARVLRVCQGVLGDRARAEEAAQEAFLRLYERWDRVSAYERPEAWVRRVALRIAVRTHRRDRALRILERGVVTDRSSGGQSGRGEDAMTLVLRLPRKQRIAVALHYVDDLPISEVARVLECAEATVRVHLHRARRRLAELLDEAVSTDV